MSLVRRPRRSNAALAAGPGVVAGLVLLSSGAPTASTLALVGLAVLGAGATVASRAGVTLGGLAQFGGVLAAGVGGADPGVLVLAAAGAVVSWTTGQHVVGLAHQLGREAPVRRSVVAHLTSATVATLSVGLLALVTFRVAAGRVPPAAIAFLLVGIGGLLVALRS